MEIHPVVFSVILHSQKNANENITCLAEISQIFFYKIFFFLQNEQQSKLRKKTSLGIVYWVLHSYFLALVSELNCWPSLQISSDISNRVNIHRLDNQHVLKDSLMSCEPQQNAQIIQEENYSTCGINHSSLLNHSWTHYDISLYITFVNGTSAANWAEEIHKTFEFQLHLHNNVALLIRKPGALGASHVRQPWVDAALKKKIMDELFKVFSPPQD